MLALSSFVVSIAAMLGYYGFDKGISPNMNELRDLRDSLDAISIPIPTSNKIAAGVELHVKTQNQWNNIGDKITFLLQNGNRNITVIIDAKQLELNDNMKGLDKLNYPEANIQILGNGVRMIPSGIVFENDNNKVRKTHYAKSLHNFNYNDIILNKNNQVQSLYNDVFNIESTIEPVKSEGLSNILNPDSTLYKTIVKTWRFRTNLPDLSESECRDFYILLSRNWTSCRHKVIRVENGYLYFNLKSEDAPSLVQLTLDPNSDMLSYKRFPRCRYLNMPVSHGIRFQNDTIYFPSNIGQLRIGRSGCLFPISYCRFNSLEISGFKVLGAGNNPCVHVNNSYFNKQLWIRNNTFENLSASAVIVRDCENVSIQNNGISNTRVNAIRCSGKNISIWRNMLNNIGYMSQTMAISFAGINIHIFENTIENFNYSGIATGGTFPNEKGVILTYVIEHNTIRLTKDYLNSSSNMSLADAGGIYVGPQNTQGIIRYNIIENISGTGANRGIFLDDGAKNLAIYGNLILNTVNCYDIDLRNSDTYSQGIPDHNTNNVIIQNIMTGNYRFEENNDDSNCFGGYNVLLGIGKFQKRVVKLREPVPDKIINGCTYKNGVVVIPKQYSDIIDSTYVDSFVRNHISIQ